MAARYDIQRPSGPTAEDKRQIEQLYRQIQRLLAGANPHVVAVALAQVIARTALSTNQPQVFVNGLREVTDRMIEMLAGGEP
jgi:hypothetical protein